MAFPGQSSPPKAPADPASAPDAGMKSPSQSGYSLRIVLMGILLALLANLALIAMVSPKPLPEWEEADKVCRLLHESHVSAPKRAKLAESAVSGMVAGLGDPYTQYLPEGEATQWESRLHGEGGLRPLAPPVEAGRPVWLFAPEHGFGYAALGRFSDRSAEELGKALALMKAEAKDGVLRGIILDLRGNPGGYLTQARDMAGLFLPAGTVVAKVKGPDFPQRILVTEHAPATDAPLVVLLDGTSASASEALAGALAEHGRAFVVGSRSFGKGCVQNVTPLGALHGKLKTTIAYYHLPSGRCLHRNGRNEADGWGVPPSAGGQVIPSPQEEKARLALLKAEPGPQPLAAAEPVTPELLKEKLHDPALAAALAALLGKAQTGAWPRVGDDPSPTQDDPHWKTREEIRTLESRLRQLRKELTVPAVPK